MSDSVRPHKRQPTRLPHPWDSQGKNTGVGCHFLPQCMKVKVKSLSRVQLLATQWTAAYQAPPFMGFARQEMYVKTSCHLCPESLLFSSVQFSSVAQSCLTLCNPMNCSTPGLPVHHQLLEFTQTHVHRVGDDIQPSHPLSSPSLPAPSPSQHQDLFQ